MGEDRKLRVGVLFGGKSAEHEISLQSARNVIAALDPDRYEVVAIGIDRQGRWHLGEAAALLGAGDEEAPPALQKAGQALAVVLGEERGDPLIEAGASGTSAVGKLDVIFPVLHGTYGEDGSVQGMLRLAGVPFVGCNVLASAVGMDKDVCKRLLAQAQIPVARWRTLRAGQGGGEESSFEALSSELGVPLFVKPASQGSSVGVSRVETAEELEEALQEAFAYDHKVIVEEAIGGREVECSVLGNEAPEASVVGEVVTDTSRHGFYSYEAKYLDASGARLQIPAELPEEVSEAVRRVAVETYRALECEGLARVDCFVTGEGRVVVNEINTMPGFTRISMYTKLWEASGLPQRQLIDRLIELAIERHRRDGALRTSR